VTIAGSGGGGGNGGPGGSGSGGTGGPSYALAFHGTKPTELNASTPTFGTGGKAGPGGTLAGSGDNPAPTGSVGDAKDRFEVKP
jgi:hypothetical protein